LNQSNNGTSKIFRFKVKSQPTNPSGREISLTVNSGKNNNFLALHPGELKQYGIRSIDAPSLFFKVSQSLGILTAKLELNQLPRLIKTLQHYSSSFVINRYQNLYEDPTLLQAGSDYKIKLIDERVSLEFNKPREGFYALSFSDVLKDKDFEIVARVSFNNQQVLESYSTSQISIEAKSKINF